MPVPRLRTPTIPPTLQFCFTPIDEPPRNHDNEKFTSKEKIPFHALFRYSSKRDMYILAFSLFWCVIHGLIHFLFILVKSEINGKFVERNRPYDTATPTQFLQLFGGGKVLVNATREENMKELANDSMAFGILSAIISIAIFVSGAIHMTLLNFNGIRITSSMRSKLFDSLLRKDIEWHDTQRGQNLSVLITDNLEKIRIAISEKLGLFSYYFSHVVLSLVYLLVVGWKLTLVTGVFIVILIVSNYYISFYQSKYSVQEQQSLMISANLIEETLGAIRTVVAFEGEKVEADRYQRELEPACMAGKKNGMYSGLRDGIAVALRFSVIGTIIGYSAFLIFQELHKVEKEYTYALAALFLGWGPHALERIRKSSPFLENFAIAMGAAAPVYENIETKTKMDPMSTEGKILNSHLEGNIVFKDVFFRYPQREDVIVLRGLNFTVKAGQTVALVGQSGCGKSTCLQLLQRFYDPAFGSILMDDLDISQYNIAWLRSNIAVVGQEPVLFQGTIGENIKKGNLKATQKDIEDAAKTVGVHDFIMSLPDKYDTMISEKGIQLSGGQKQRITIARALIRRPRILLLDEPTSALDYQSEKVVQEALNIASKGRTTILVSHRISAIKDADRILFIKEGKIIEEGTHEELMELQGNYYIMVSTHQSEDENRSDDKNQQNEGCPAEQNSNNLGRNVLNKNHLTHQKNVKENTDEEKPLTGYTLVHRIMQITRGEWHIFIGGGICSIIFTFANPSLAYLKAEFLTAIGMEDADIVYQKVVALVVQSFITAIVLGVTCYLQTYLISLSGILTTIKFRCQTFKNILGQEMSWFDEKQNSVGTLSASISGDSARIRNTVGFTISIIVQAIIGFIVNIVLAFLCSWKITLSTIIFGPILIGTMLLEMRFIRHTSTKEREILEELSRMATEAITNIRTTAALCLESQMIQDYNNQIEKCNSMMYRFMRYRGLIASGITTVAHVTSTVGTAYGGTLLSQNEITISEALMADNFVFYGFQVLGYAIAFTPTLIVGLGAAQRLFQLIDRKPKIYPATQYFNSMLIKKSMGGVSYRDISFTYPTRPSVQILRNFNLNVAQGKVVALVGASGCGKSTCIQLLLRFYDPDQGNIYIDDDDIRQNIPLVSLRRRIGIVSQEPVLFEKTIAENISYGDNSRKATMAEIIEAAKMANAYAFITALPLGFDTQLGPRGTALSGGQKQRIAIARVLLRNPQILLLDEATSALDLQNEKIVQESLEVACGGRTSIIVAHRLSTIQNADLICVVQNGCVAEQGTHSQLLSLNGIYAKLCKDQNIVN